MTKGDNLENSIIGQEKPRMNWKLKKMGKQENKRKRKIRKTRKLIGSRALQLNYYGKMEKYKGKIENWKNWKVRKNQEIVKKWKWGKIGKIGKKWENRKKIGK